ncbi:DUF2946 domain-containing protein [Thauera sp. WH-2]|jgi:hypothetical protein|uniref:DUF2946 domain-containing protein n=1 Tax=Thauera sp. WH-2 TaxID=3401574 RepID=UPI003AAE4F54
MQRSRQRLFAWVAIFAMMLSALAPAISRAMGPDENGRYFVQVCSAAGIEWVAVSAAEAEFYADVETRDDKESGKGGALSLDQCPYCSAAYTTTLLPTLASPEVFSVRGGEVLPALFLVSPRPLFVWAPSHPRAPPAHA